MQRFAFPVVLASLVGLIGLVPPANAAHDLKTDPGSHENSPSPPASVVDGVCPVTGTVLIDNSNGDGGVDPAGQVNGKNHNHFRFQDVVINCNGGPVPGEAIVHASGGTDGPGECDALSPGKEPQCRANHGEDASAGWSHSSCYNNAIPKGPRDCDSMKTGSGKNVDDIYDGTHVNPPGTSQCNNCGEIWVENQDTGQQSCTNITESEILNNTSDSEDCANFLKFCRGIYNDDINANGVSDITEWGSTCSNIGQGGTITSAGGGNVLAWGAFQNFTGKPAHFVVCFFTALQLQAIDQNAPVGKLDFAVLEGTLFTWRVTDPEDCDGQKNPQKIPTNG